MRFVFALCIKPLENSTKMCYTYDILNRAAKRTNVLSEEGFAHDSANKPVSAGAYADHYGTKAFAIYGIGNACMVDKMIPYANILS
jgi:hypothetical protein